MVEVGRPQAPELRSGPFLRGSENAGTCAHPRHEHPPAATASKPISCKEVAYYNHGKGHLHPRLFYYDDTRGIMLASGSEATHVLMLQPQMTALSS
jgi:hypothetical protein